MAYAEKHGRGWRARWHDQDGSLRSASGFASRKQAEGYGRDREAGLRAYSFTRPQLIAVLQAVPTSFAIDALEYEGGTPADLADAIIEALEDGKDAPREGEADGG